VYEKRAPWFTNKLPSFFEPGGILSDYRKSSVVSIRKKNSEAESKAKAIYTARLHQSNDDSQDEILPLFASIFLNISILIKLGIPVKIKPVKPEDDIGESADP